MIADALLSRLDKVKQTADNSWLACCPAHDDHRPSLIVTEEDDRVLIHCRAGCPPGHVVGEVGLDLSDLFPPRNGRHGESDHGKRQKRSYFPAKAVLATVGEETAFVALCASHMAQGQKLNSADHDRLMIAAARLNEAREIAGL